MSTLVIHHNNCTDGFAAAFIAKTYGPPGVELYPANHGESPPDVKGKKVVIVDFCYPLETLTQMQSQAKSLTVLDHHKSSMAECGHLDFCKFDMNKSGAMLAWEYWCNGTPTPWWVQYIQDQDLWTWTLPFSREVGICISTIPPTLEEWTSFTTKMTVEEAVTQGSAILRYQRQVIRDTCEGAVPIELCGKKVLAVQNASHLLSSSICERLYHTNGCQVALSWHIGSDGFVYGSLRSKSGGEHDVSLIAETFDVGGGHKHSAGFVDKKGVILDLLLKAVK